MQLLEGRQVARRLKLRAGTLEHLVQSGTVRDYAGKYDLDEVQRAIAPAAPGRALEGSSTTRTLGTQTELEASETTLESAGVHALGVARDLTEKSLSHEAQMFALYVKGLENQQADARSNLKIMQDENAALRRQVSDQHDQIVGLQAKYIETLAAHEEAISQAHTRRLNEQQLAAVNKRRDQGLEMLKQAVPPLVASITATFEQKNLAAQLFSTFEPGQLQAMLDPEVAFFNPKQAALIQQMIASMQRAEAAKQKPASAPAATHGAAPNGAAATNGAPAPAQEKPS